MGVAHPYYYYTTGRELIAKIIRKLIGIQERPIQRFRLRCCDYDYLLTQRYYNFSEIHHSCRVESSVLLAECAHTVN